MKINWINHAGFIIEHNNIVLACDPWIEGNVFNNSWSLLSKSKFQYSDFEKVTHIWFSHEHPDHFNPPNLKKIDQEIRKNIIVLYQKTDDKKVIDFISKLNFKEVIELPPSEWYFLDEKLKILNQNDRSGDSWLAVNDGYRTLLNMNDVATYTTKKELENIHKIVGSIDILMTQFSYASWAGNKEDSSFRKKLCAQKKEAISMQSNVFKPKFTIPFASFVWFCREENFYANNDANKIEDILTFIENKTESTPILLYPGDTWNLSKEIDNTTALNKYITDRNKIINKDNLIPSQKTPLKDLQNLAKKFGKRQWKHHSNLMLLLKLRKSAKIFIEDLDTFVLFNLHGIKIVNKSREDADIILNSEHLRYCLEFDWGGDTLNVNGCFQIPQHGDLKKFMNYFYFSKQINLGKRYNYKTAIQNLIRKYSH
ncbi:MBL fold metallo-hydrolase [Tenacibaculum maritimum]|uniref:MBL fold metallo-hydrolase n=1 Tax=Tenacibaculum maritimum TaxID=107401 RepID=UPI0012E540F5|nr:MBL fold metallo-hydrolase [Tenacibaculum maritimum]MCD9562276.1 MBL fold metallo-hydrolase [Tenacibaculum maritimum]MCD9565825.1 MBL fold metallo-hydrolase [Tenacibaculum maritimum]MCD9577976.1 MBL fold metallo-hydrolase [Tenacibaculum maritimum]MCD9585954.1 MBL fold metallo-hydrolase [Tenacibaculum maritimum]MCD9597097.1 MBL fold metallo-hydrolase [Tenacibaculum maritimum]